MIPRCSLALLFPALVLGARFSDGPPDGHTGGFGEPTCADCHMDFEVNEGPGALEVSGLPDRVTPGEVYDLRVLLRHAGMMCGGFQLTVRTADGVQAGRLQPVTDRTAASEDAGIVYVSQTETGSFPSGDSLVWSVRWSAPDSVAGDLSLHAAGNAANGDDSPFEDYVYTGAWTLNAN